MIGFFQIRTLCLAGSLVLAGVFFCCVVGANADPQSPPLTVTQSPKMTVAVVVTPLQADGSAWDVGAGADIVLCGQLGCYVSQGLEQEALFYEGSGAFRLLKKAGPCRDALACVFRGVELDKLASDKDPFLQLVDVDYVSHTYMDKVAIKQPLSCQLNGAVLSCAKGVHKRTFSMWAIDEVVAKKGGKSGLDQVLFKGLISQRVSALVEDLETVRGQLGASGAQFYRLVLGQEVPSTCLDSSDFIGETFYIMGLADAKQRRAEHVIKDFVGAKPVVALKAVVQRSPQLYWAFLDIAKQFNAFARAKTAELSQDIEGIRLYDQEEGGTLLKFDWRVQARAKALLETCKRQEASGPLEDRS